MQEFALNLRKDFNDAKIILFGSRAGKDYLIESDFDVLVISKEFEGIKFFERTAKMYDYWKEKQALEALCYTPKEFKEKSVKTGIVQQAIKTGIKA